METYFSSKTKIFTKKKNKNQTNKQTDEATFSGIGENQVNFLANVIEITKLRNQCHIYQNFINLTEKQTFNLELKE